MTTPTIETAEDAAKLQAAEGSKARLNNREKHQLSLLLMMISDAAERDEDGLHYGNILPRVEAEMKRREFRIYHCMQSCEWFAHGWTEIYWGDVNKSEQATLYREATLKQQAADREAKAALRPPIAPDTEEDHSLPSGASVLAFFLVAAVIAAMGTLLAGFIALLSK
jgi:hypothetical protein